MENQFLTAISFPYVKNYIWLANGIKVAEGRIESVQLKEGKTLLEIQIILEMKMKLLKRKIMEDQLK